MSGIFRLCHYLRRPGEKQPLLLLEPVLCSGTDEFFLSNSPDGQRAASGMEPGNLQWYLYGEGGACEAIELRKLQALNTSENARQQLLRELRDEASGDKPAEEALAGLWQGSVKGIATRRLERGQIIASEGVWLVSERSFYVLLSCSPELWRHLRSCRSEQRVELCERTTGRCSSGLLAVLEQFDRNRTIPNSGGDVGEDVGEDVGGNVESGDGSEQLILCRLRLDHRQLISMNQVLSFSERGTRAEAGGEAENGPEGFGGLYSLRFSLNAGLEAGLEPDLEADDALTPKTDSLSGGKGEGTAQEWSLFLFAPTNCIESSFALRKFLLSRLKSVGRDSSTNSAKFLQDLAADFIGWGEYHKNIPASVSLPAPTGRQNSGSWQHFGAWRFRSDLLQKYGPYIYQRACQFGGYRIDLLEEELTGGLPASVVKSLLVYLHDSRVYPGSGSAGNNVQAKSGLEGQKKSESQDRFRTSCLKVDGHLLAWETVHPALQSLQSLDFRAGRAVDLEGLEGENPELGPVAEPKHISPLGRKMLQDLRAVGERGFALHRLEREQRDVLQALLRSGWVVIPSSESSRCYAREYAGNHERIQGTDHDMAFRRDSAAESAGGNAGKRALNSTLARYKKKNELREMSQNPDPSDFNRNRYDGHKGRSDRNTFGRSPKPEGDRAPRNIGDSGSFSRSFSREGQNQWQYQGESRGENRGQNREQNHGQNHGDREFGEYRKSPGYEEDRASPPGSAGEVRSGGRYRAPDQARSQTPRQRNHPYEHRQGDNWQEYGRSDQSGNRKRDGHNDRGNVRDRNSWDDRKRPRRDVPHKFRHNTDGRSEGRSLNSAEHRGQGANRGEDSRARYNLDNSRGGRSFEKPEHPNHGNRSAGNGSFDKRHNSRDGRSSDRHGFSSPQSGSGSRQSPSKEKNRGPGKGQGNRSRNHNGRAGSANRD
ncbi:hypothetical protein P0082_11910 [Candidatus Haliotispira prima]|uniref:Uncharacterized protein n=1 Tax=Candidatus Haliotispira prima TaxID=3034016 RepID=A0ABY8MGM3_9SPIO|nr:hypothetical protein P0082_11910 [Candidatus Haliotispira prima]